MKFEVVTDSTDSSPEERSKFRKRSAMRALDAALESLEKEFEEEAQSLLAAFGDVKSEAEMREFLQKKRVELHDPFENEILAIFKKHTRVFQWVKARMGRVVRKTKNGNSFLDADLAARIGIEVE